MSNLQTWQSCSIYTVKSCFILPPPESSNGSFNIKASSGYKFGCLAKIVNYMKVRPRMSTFLIFHISVFIPLQLIEFKQKDFYMNLFSFWVYCVGLVSPEWAACRPVVIDVRRQSLYCRPCESVVTTRQLLCFRLKLTVNNLGRHSTTDSRVNIFSFSKCRKQRRKRLVSCGLEPIPQ